MDHRFSRKSSGLMIKIPEMTFPQSAILTAATSALLLLLLQGSSCDRPASGVLARVDDDPAFDAEWCVHRACSLVRVPLPGHETLNI